LEFIKLPLIGLSEESAIVSEYYVNIGDFIEEGDNIFSVETGKTTYDVPAEIEGYVLDILEDEGTEVLIGAPLLVVGEKDEKYTRNDNSLNEKNNNEISKENSIRVENSQKQELISEEMSIPSGSFSEPKNEGYSKHGSSGLSPRARKLADKHDIDVSTIIPTGPNGVIIEKDVQTYLDERMKHRAKYASVSESTYQNGKLKNKEDDYAEDITYSDYPLTTIRRTIASNLQKATQEMAMASMVSSFDATQIMTLRKQFKQSEDPSISGIGIGDMIYYAIAKTIVNYPEFNSNFLAEQGVVRSFDHVHMGIAVDTPRGLMVPTIFNADLLSLKELSNKVRMLADDCREGNIDPKLLQGASLTVSNMGAAGADVFAPIVNPPQVIIVGIARLKYAVRLNKNEEFEFYPSIPIGATIDHRVVDGSPTGRFLMDVSKKLENFTELLV